MDSRLTNGISLWCFSDSLSCCLASLTQPSHNQAEQIVMEEKGEGRGEEERRVERRKKEKERSRKERRDRSEEMSRE